MKRYFLLLITLLVCILPSNVNAQIAGGAPSRTWTYPAVTSLDEPVTWYFDMTGSAFTAGEDLYLWDWSPSEPDAGNWAKSSDFAKLTYQGTMVWSITLTPSQYFSMTPDAILASAGFWMRLKDLTGTIQSDVINMPMTAPILNTFASSGSPTSINPTSLSLNAPVSIMVNINQVATANGVGALKNATALYFNSGLNDFDSTASVKVDFKDPANLAKTKLTKVNDSIYKFDMIPSQYYNVPDGYSMRDIAFTIESSDGSTIGTALGGANFVYSAVPVVPLTPVLTIFPTKFSQKDLIVLERDNNESSVSKLSYVITAGTKTLTGDFSGTSKSLKAYIDLLTQLSGQSALTRIHLKISDNTGRVLLDADIPLVQLSQLD